MSSDAVVIGLLRVNIFCFFEHIFLCRPYLRIHSFKLQAFIYYSFHFNLFYFIRVDTVIPSMSIYASRKHAYIILTPLNPTFI